MLPDSPARGGKECPLIAIIGMALRFPGGMNSAEDFWKFMLLDDPAMQNFFVVRYITKMESWRRKAHST
jgi:hypothetical protein